MGFNEAFEAFTSNLYKRKTLAGEFIVVNKYLMADLMELDLWNKDIKDQIMINEGSVQSIEAIPANIRERYKTVWEIKQKVVIDMAADRGAFICQSQSMNLFVESPDFTRLSSMHFYAWQKGLKTGMYYLRTKPKANAQQFTIDPRKAKSNIEAPKLAVAATTQPTVEAPPPPATEKAEADDEEVTQVAVGCKWKPGCKTCSS
jgi:ribonucleoside-diphosphate reductase alpha chain